MKNRYLYLEIIGWLILIMCLLSGMGMLDSELVDELTTFMILSILSYYIRKGVWYYMNSLSLGILLDAPIDPYCLTDRQFSWILGSTILLIIYYIIKYKYKQNEQYNTITSFDKEDANRKSSIV